MTTGLALGSTLAGLIAGAYLLANVQIARWLSYLVSDALAVFLVALCLALTVRALSGTSKLAWGVVGLCLGALILVKAIFVLAIPSVIIAGVVGAMWLRDGRILSTVFLLALMASLAPLGWSVRNATVTGHMQLADDRGGMVLSTREVLIHMTPREYAAAFLFWSRGPGPDLARRWFGRETADKFDLEASGGFYDVGQNGYSARVDAKIASGTPVRDAVVAVDREVRASIVAHPVSSLATMVPVFYRGLWIDQFAIIGISALVWMTHVGIRRHNQWLLIAGFGWLNLFAYTAASLNIPRYQMTALPPIAIAVGLMLSKFLTAKNRSARLARLFGQHGRTKPPTRPV
jgi:4-amino-4-deoxy-L-arabinose transferase-like glycosyltransferase